MKQRTTVQGAGTTSGKATSSAPNAAYAVARGAYNVIQRDNKHTKVNGDDVYTESWVIEFDSR